MRVSLLLATSAVALMTGPAWAQDEQQPEPAATEEQQPAATGTEQPATEPAAEQPAIEQPAAEQAATEQPPAEGATETQVVTTTGGGEAPAGDPMQALTQAGEQLQQVSQQMQGGEGGDQQQMQQQATQALDQFDQALQQASQSGDQAMQEQVTQLQQQSEQVRQQLQDDPQGASQGLQELADAAAGLQTASIPSEADAIMGRQIVTSDGEEGGEVSDILITADGRVEALLVERGGALGLGGQQVAITWDQIQLQGDQVTVSLTRDEMEQLPEYQTE